MHKLMNTIEDVCERTSLGRSYIYEKLASGELAYVKAGRRTLIPEDALLAFVASLQVNDRGTQPVDVVSELA